MKIEMGSKESVLLKSLSSETRIIILEMLMERPMNISELAERLNLSSAIVTRHISMLENSKLIKCKNIPGKRGIQKLCYLAVDELVISFKGRQRKKEGHTISIPVGQYHSYEVSPSCGLASREDLVGVFDDPRYFSDPGHVKASLVWFASGFVEYRIPCYIFNSREIEAIEISLEICSEHPGYNEDWPSDIYFYLNDVLLGKWTSPGDFGDKKGIYTPDWWRGGTQYGMLKQIRVTRKGTTLDGIKLSEVTLDQIPIDPKKDMFFKIASPKETTHPGGLNIFGRGFGNYDQDIEISVEYK